MPIGLNSASMYSPPKLKRSIPQQQTLSFQAGNQQSETENCQDEKKGSSFLRKAVKIFVFMALLGGGVYGVSKCGNSDFLKIGQNANDITKSVYGAINNVGRSIVNGARFLVEKISPKTAKVVSGVGSKATKAVVGSNVTKVVAEEVAEEGLKKAVVASTAVAAAKKTSVAAEASSSESLAQNSKGFRGELSSFCQEATQEVKDGWSRFSKWLTPKT